MPMTKDGGFILDEPEAGGEMRYPLKKKPAGGKKEKKDKPKKPPKAGKDA